ncbi:MAG: hypothetical protein ACLQVL_07305 [Terriglobia bacterium]
MKASYLKQVIGYFDPMQSLDEKHKDWYVERPDSPEEAIKIYLINNPTDTKILFSGHRGSGKTSTLSKLARDVEIQGKFFVVKFSIKDEINVADLTYTDLLLAIGHRLYEEGKAWLNSKLIEDLDKWSADVSRVTTKSDEAGVEVEAGISAWFLKAKGLLKTGFEDKREFRQKFEPRVPQLIEFINRIIRAIETHSDAGGREVLLILEDLDKPPVDVAMDLFSTKGTVLIQPECKIIFTVPTSLLYSGQYNVVKENFSDQFPLPNFKIKEKSGERNEPGWARMREIVERRMEPQIIESKALDHAVEMSGGVVRELVRIIQGAASRALVAKANVIKFEHVEHAVDKLRMEYSYSLTRDEYIDILRKVHDSKELRYPNEKPLLDLLHNLFILQYPNGPGWYGVNPIVHKLIGVGA